MRARAEPDLQQRLAGLRTAVAAVATVGADDDGTTAAVERAEEVLQRAGQRRELSGEHTVAALAGATGSGKSSLLNALAGFDAATVGARRPTTAHPLALVWSSPAGPAADAAGPLLDWLEVPSRHEVAVPGDGAAVPAGLVLLDLPDIDSVQTEHRRRAERLARTVDVLVWVLDPQKYADAVVHAEFLRPMARHAAVTLVVLNQVDRLAPDDRAGVLADLRRRLAQDGLDDVRVLTTSARTGDGIDALREALRELVQARRAADARLAADVATAAAALDEACPAAPPGEVPPAARRRLVEALAVAAGVERVADAVATSFRFRARARTGWPLVRWLGRFRPDPLRRLHLPRGTATPDAPVTTTTSSPPASPVQRAQVETALRSLGDAAAAGSADPWRTYLRQGATEGAGRLPDALDQAVVRTDLGGGRGEPRWFAAVGVLQWLVFAVFAAGALWLGAYALLGYLRIDVGWVPQIGPVPADPPLPPFPAIPWPTALLVGGAVLGVVVALVCGAAARVGASRRRRRARQALRASVSRTAQERVLSELENRRAVVAAFADGVGAARGGAA